MRRVYDDTQFEETRNWIDAAFGTLQYHPEKVRKHSYGMNRTEPALVRDAVLRRLNGNKNLYKFGNTTHAHGIGNNNATEIIYLGNPAEEQICGLIHVNDDMYGRCFCYVTDIDGNRKSVVKKI